MSLALNPNFIYGLNSQTRQNAYFLSNDKIIYPAGGVLVIQDLNESHNQTYIHLHDKQRPLNVLSMSPKKDIVATGEGGGQPVVSLYSVASCQHLASLAIPSDLRAQNVVCLQFTCDAQFLIAVTSEPDWMLLCYNVAARSLDSKTRANMAAQPTGKVTQVSCNPTDPTTLAVVGPGLFRLLQLVDGSWRQFGFYKAQAFPLLSVSWLTSDRLLAGTEDGRLLLIESNELKAVFEASGLPLVCLPTKDTLLEENIPGPASQCVTAIIAHSNGFLIGLGNPCQIAVYKQEQGARYPLVGIFDLKPCPSKQDDSDAKSDEEANAVWWLDISPDSKHLLTSSIQVQLYTATLEALINTDSPAFLNPLGEPLHRGAVVGLSMCVWRPIFASCGFQDRSVRIWNYSTGLQELSKTFSSQPLCVSIHPLGLFLLVGFGHSVCLLSVQLEDFLVIRELAVRGCRDCQFSNGGQHFAVAHGSRVQVISAITFSTLHSLQGHCAQVEGLCWSQDDAKLVTCGADGAVYEWDVASGKRLEELVTKGTFYQDVSTLANGKTNFVVAGDTSIREISKSQLVRNVPCNSGSTELQLAVTLLSRDCRTLLVASRCGTVLAVALPLGDEATAVSRGMCMHSAPVTKMAVSHDGGTVVSCSEDGSLCVWKFGEAGLKRSEKVRGVEQVLVGRTQLSNLSLLASSLADRLAHQQEEQESALQHQARAFQQLMENTKDEHQKQIDRINAHMEEVSAAQQEEVANTKKAAHQALTQHEEALESVEDEYQAKLLVEYHKVEQLEQKLVAQEIFATTQLAEIKASNADENVKTCNNYEAEIKSLKETIEKLQEERRNTSAVHEEVVRQVEQDADKEIIQLKISHERALRLERQQVEQLTGEVQSTKKKVTGSQQEVKQLQQQKLQQQEEITQLQGNIASLEQHIVEQKKLMERNNIILEDKERDLAEVRKLVTEITKQKETINFRMEMLSQHIGPKDDTIKEKTLELEQLGRELRVERSQRGQLEVELSSVNAQLRQAQRRALVEQTRHRDAERNTSRLRARVHELGSGLQNPKQLQRLASELYRDYGRDGVPSEDHPTEVLMELRRQIETLQDMNNSLIKKLKNIEENHRNEKNALKQECITLMKKFEKLQNKRANEFEER